MRRHLGFDEIQKNSCSFPIKVYGYSCETVSDKIGDIINGDINLEGRRHFEKHRRAGHKGIGEILLRTLRHRWQNYGLETNCFPRKIVRLSFYCFTDNHGLCRLGRDRTGSISSQSGKVWASAKAG